MAKDKKKLDYEALASSVIANVGGKKNIKSLRHCYTRLRFVLKDRGLTNTEAIKETDGVVSVVEGNDEYMVVIGTNVAQAYDAVIGQIGSGFGEDSTGSVDDGEDDGRKSNLFSRVLSIIMASMQPIVNMICACGIIKGILAILVMAGLTTVDSGLYILLNGMGDAIFYFLPLALGYMFMKNLGGSPFLGFLIGGILCYPSLNGNDIELFGRVVNATYTGTFLPVAFIVAVAAPMEKWLNIRISNFVKGFLVPVIVLVITIPLGFTIIGPVANMIGNGINAAITAVFEINTVLAGIVAAGTWQILILFGVHGVPSTFMFANLAAGNTDQYLAMILLVCFSQCGVVLAVFLKTKSEKLKSVALPAFISGFVGGITEPAIYGVTLPRIKMFVLSCISASIGGVFIALFGITGYSFTGTGPVAVLGMLNPEDPHIIPVLICLVIYFVSGLGLGLVFYKDEGADLKDAMTGNETEQPKIEGRFIIEAPVPGKVVPVSEVPDETFSTGMMGKGFAVEPSEGKVYAPFDGVCVGVFDTLHAIGLKSDHGIELLIHIGIDTVSLEGKPFKAHIKSGEHIRKGQLILEFNMDEIKKAGYPTISPILVTNEDEVGTVKIENDVIVVEA